MTRSDEGGATRDEVGAEMQATKAREFYTLGLVLGARYDGSPTLVPHGTRPPAEDASTYVPSACPAALPHAWLADGSSLRDHFGPGLTLLATETPAEGEAAPLVADAARRGLPLKLVAPGLRTRYEARFELIRPDQHVTWRGDVLPNLGQLLGRVTGYD